MEPESKMPELAVVGDVISATEPPHNEYIRDTPEESASSSIDYSDMPELIPANLVDIPELVSSSNNNVIELMPADLEMPNVSTHDEMPMLAVFEKPFVT
jgi:hypothetical protein